MTHRTKTYINVLAAAAALGTLASSPSGATVHPSAPIPALDAARSFSDGFLPSDVAAPRTPKTEALNPFKVAAGRGRRSRRLVIRRDRTAPAQQAQTQRRVRGANGGFSTGQSRAPQSDGVFDSQDLIQVFSSGEYND